MSIQRGLAGCALVMAFLMTPAVSTAQPVAWGGGCQSTVGIRPCIAAYGPSMPLTVRTDWYLIGFGTAEYGGSYTEWTCIAGVSCTLLVEIGRAAWTLVARGTKSPSGTHQTTSKAFTTVRSNTGCRDRRSRVRVPGARPPSRQVHTVARRVVQGYGDGSSRVTARAAPLDRCRL